MSSPNRKRGRPRKNPEAHEHDLTIARSMPDPTSPEGWCRAVEYSAVLARRVAGQYNRSGELDDINAAWRHYRHFVDIFALNANLAHQRRQVVKPVMVDENESIERAAEAFHRIIQGQAKPTDFEPYIQDWWEALIAHSKRELHEYDVPVEAFLALFDADPTTPGYTQAIIGTADEVLHQYGSAVKPDCLVVGLRKAGGEEVVYTNHTQASETLNCLVHHKLIEPVLLRNLFNLMADFGDLPLTWDDLARLKKMLEETKFTEVARTLSLPIDEEKAREVLEHPWVKLYQNLTRREELLFLTDLVDAMVTYSAYLFVRRKCFGLWGTPHLRFCAHPGCSAPAFVEQKQGSITRWPPPKGRNMGRPVFYCTVHADQAQNARVYRGRRRA